MNENKVNSTETIEWQGIFSAEQLEEATEILMTCDVTRLRRTNFGAEVTFKVGKQYIYTEVISSPTHGKKYWNPTYFNCSCRQKQLTVYFANSRRIMARVCAHEAALLMLWEDKHGPWEFKLTDEEVLERAREQERIRGLKEIEQEKREIIVASEFISEGNEDTLFDIPTIASKYNTNRYALKRAHSLMDRAEISFGAPEKGYDFNGEPTLTLQVGILDEEKRHQTGCVLGLSALNQRRCSCNSYYIAPFSAPLCEHELILLKKAKEYIDLNKIGDATDAFARELLNAMTLPVIQDGQNEVAEKRKEVRVSPYITVNGREVSLSFQIGTSGKLIALRNLQSFLDAVEEESVLTVSKTVKIDFSRSDFTEDSEPWVQFIRLRVGEISSVNRRLGERADYVRSLTATSQEILNGPVLDKFYELAEGTSCEYKNKKEKTKGCLRIGHTDLRINLRSQRIASRQGTFLGIEISGEMPVFLQGCIDSYILTEDCLSKVTKAEVQTILPFQNTRDEDGNVRFRIGKDSLGQFYNHVLPGFRKSPFIEYEDFCEEEVLPLLPPEPRFVFKLDIEEYACICMVEVFYEENRYVLGNASSNSDSFRDNYQEERIRKLLLGYLGRFDPEAQIFWEPVSDDLMYCILTQAIPTLSQYGEVQGTDAFKRYSVRSQPVIQVGVKVESGLLDISVLSTDLSPKELLSILDSYRRKKKYHKLKSGSFIELEDADQLASLDEVLQSMDLDAADVIQNHAKIPLFRALYLNEKLREHDELVSNRDRTYRTLVKNFDTVRDAEYEVPQAQADKLRPYQEYGYKWLRTLTAAGFGGILADDMGLGKTLQAITLLQGLKDDGEKGVSLVVCPASLLYNWEEEISKFAPGLSVLPIAGTPKVRQGQIAKLKDGDVDVCITSYDLLRKDLQEYKDLTFLVMFLDEAQYIKNQNAGLTKAVKAVSAVHRFALTGTPIENRLSELWSIFDFLMPGFLYSYKEFSGRFETPIVRKQDPRISETLRRMISPYVLRRLKTDVLKDLPGKLEEVRYTRFEEDQKRVYDGQVVRMKQILENPDFANEDRFRILTEMTKVRQICCDPSLILEGYKGESAKRIACMELIQSASSGGHRMLVFSQFTSMLSLLEEDLEREGIPYMKLTGATPKEQRVHMVREFNSGTTPVFLISLKAGGTGLNLTGADIVIHYDPWWNLAAQNQATDRAHRIGQKNTVTVYRLIVKDTIEEKILELQEAKKDLADSVLTGEHTSITTLSNEELLALLS